MISNITLHAEKVGIKKEMSPFHENSIACIFEGTSLEGWRIGNKYHSGADCAGKLATENRRRELVLRDKIYNSLNRTCKKHADCKTITISKPGCDDEPEAFSSYKIPKKDFESQLELLYKLSAENSRSAEPEACAAVAVIYPLPWCSNKVCTLENSPFPDPAYGIMPKMDKNQPPIQIFSE